VGTVTGRVLQLFGPSSGGIRRHVAVLAEELATLGWESTVAGPAEVMDGVGRQDAVVPVSIDPRSTLRATRALRAVVRSSDPAVVHAHGLKAGWVAVLAGVRRPIVVTLHNRVLAAASGRGHVVLQWLERALPRRIAALIVVSDELTVGLGTGARPEVIAPAGPLPVPDEDEADVRARYQVGVDQQLVVTVARLHPQKDLGRLLRAAHRVREVRPAVRFVVVGDGPQRAALAAEASALGLDGTVHFAGHRQNAANELRAADVVAVSSLWEGSPLVVVEALRLGRPLVATAVGAIPQVVEDGVTGRLVASQDADALAAAILDLLGEPDRAADLGAAGQALVERTFDPAVLSAQVAEVYQRVRGGAPT
jgi:glycosyltransferase involved in cell wall biosynthesis